MVLCACGCGMEIIPKSWHKYYGMPKYILGHISEETKNKISLSRKGKFSKENHPRWKGGKPHCKVCGEILSRYGAEYCYKHVPRNVGKKDKIDKFLKNLEKIYCQCGCGEEIHIERRFFRIGIPKYIHGHSSKITKPGYGRLNKPQFSKRVCYKEYMFRSSWEASFAQFLDNINETWVYESKTFELDNETYTPDFYLPNRNLWIEIKGYWYPKHKEKFEAFLEKYPEERIKLIMHKPPYTEEDLE